VGAKIVAEEIRRNVGKADDAIKGERKNSGGKIVLSRERGREVSTLTGRNWWDIQYSVVMGEGGVERL
jgi:hypothetical protein